MTENSIAFYAPLKPIDHPVPSGDRMMASLLVHCMQRAGFRIDIASRLRVFFKDPDNVDYKQQIEKQAEIEIERLKLLWLKHRPPALWFCYHPYFKSPDLIGPRLCELFDLPYVTAEASYSPRRTQGVWAETQQSVLAALDKAATNICFTQRDSAGIAKVLPLASLARLKPFIDTSFYTNRGENPGAAHLMTVAMMRSGDKFDSYTHLANALELMLDHTWTLSVVGDGVMQKQVKELFRRIPENRINWLGRLDRTAISDLLSTGSVYVWPGCGEAYGLAYLEAQAAGLPVVAFETAGVPEVVDHNHTGLLTPAGNAEALAQAMIDLLTDQNLLQCLSRSARRHVQHYHSASTVCAELNRILQTCQNRTS